jgi:CDP-diacylglycerol--glycerol-3-phosphate 3-phosphatidyltransferase
MYDRFFTVPNVISIARIMLIVPIAYMLKDNTLSSNLAAFFLIGIAYVTDFLDGLIARLTRQISRIGMILDPMGDKLLAVTTAVVLYIQGRLPFYFFILILSRDVIISMGALYAMNRKGLILPPQIYGKATTIAMGVVLAIYPLLHSCAMQFHFFAGAIAGIVTWGTWICSFLLVLSGVLYTVYYFRNFLLQKKQNRQGV